MKNRVSVNSYAKAYYAKRQTEREQMKNRIVELEAKVVRLGGDL